MSHQLSTVARLARTACLAGAVLWLGIAGTAVAEESPVSPVSMTDDPCTDLTDSTLRGMYCEEDDEQS